ncbi:MAG TPA: hypothetical protein PKE40_15725 [Arachnia sp.]|nr:hypothetical protein [Arachnia sp.]HMT87790.1 hypothetical protein [Arachnia sp.]
MGHTTNCETATTYTCVCPCGGARHRAILIRGIATSDAATQVEATDWAEPRRWTRLPEETRATTVKDRRPAVAGIVSELVIALVEQARSDGEIDAVAALAHQISDEIGDEFERHLDGGGPDHRNTRHLWCVVLATICRLYDHGFDLVNATLDDLVEDIMKTLREDISTDRGEESQPRDIYQYRYRIVAAFEVAEYAFLEALIKKAVHAVTTAVQEIGEEAAFKHLRLIGAITCPDPDRHPDVVKHCLWPLLSGPFKEMLEDTIATEMRTWLCNAYPVVPAD